MRKTTQEFINLQESIFNGIKEGVIHERSGNIWVSLLNSESGQEVYDALSHLVTENLNDMSNMIQDILKQRGNIQ